MFQKLFLADEFHHEPILKNVPNCKIVFQVDELHHEPYLNNVPKVVFQADEFHHEPILKCFKRLNCV